MPYSRRNFKKKPRKQMKRFPRRPFSSKQVKAIVKLAQKSGELKQKSDIETMTSLVETNPHLHDLGDFAISQGTDNDERIGDKIKIKDLSYIVRLYPGSVGYDTSAGHQYRICCIQELDNGSFATASFPNPDEFWPNSETADVRYKLLYNKVVVLNPDVKNSMRHEFRISGNKLKQVVFDDALATISQNNVKMAVIPLSTTANQLSVTTNARIRYYDV